MKLNLLGLSLAIFGLSLAETLSTKDHFNRLCGSSSSYHGKVTNINGHDFKVFCNQAISASDATRIDGVVTPEQCGQICTISKCLDSLWSDSGHCWLKEAKSTPYTTSSTTTFLVLQRVNTVEECKADLETCKAKGPGDNDDDSELEDPFLKPSEGNCVSKTIKVKGKMFQQRCNSDTSGTKHVAGYSDARTVTSRTQCYELCASLPDCELAILARSGTGGSCWIRMSAPDRTPESYVQTGKKEVAVLLK